MTRLQALAADYSARFEQKTRDNGRNFWIVKDGQETEELSLLCQDAHGDMLPDDWKYDFIVDALDAISEADDADDASENLRDYVYNADCTRWLASHLDRADYCDQAAKDMGFNPDKNGIFSLISWGMRTEQAEVLGSVLSSLRQIIEDADLTPEDEIPEDAAWDALPSTFDTQDTREEIEASWTATEEGERFPAAKPVYEHGQWWMRDNASNASWSVCDDDSEHGFCFEEIDAPDED